MIEKDGAMTFEDSPYIMEILTALRDERTDSINFRRFLSSLGRYMAYEITKTMDYEKIDVKTPLANAKGVKIKDMENVVLITVLRASIPFMEGVIKVLEKARMGVVSASRGSPPKFEIEMNYVRIPKIKKDDILIIVDPMIATGSTLVKVIEECEKRGKAKRRIILGVLAAPEGIKRIKEKFEDVEIYVADVDEKLNERGYIIPGLGDAGDRAFNTEFE